MGRLQQVSGAIALGLFGAFSGGCVNLHPEAKVAAPAVSESRTDPGVQQASAKVPASVPTASIAALAKAVNPEVPRGAATEIAMAWQNKVAQLPDPSRNGTMGHGVVGQMFLFAADSKPAAANGRLTVEMFDQTPRPGNEGKRLGTWTFEKDVLKRLATMDERFGKSYALFLPWPDYDPTVARVKLTVRFEPERGYPLYAPATTLTFDNGPSDTVHQRTQTTRPGTSTAGFGGLNPPAPISTQPLPPLDPLPVGGRNAQSTPPNTPLPPGLPSLVITPKR